jgi:hypothetical protein
MRATAFTRVGYLLRSPDLLSGSLVTTHSSRRVDR